MQRKQRRVWRLAQRGIALAALLIVLLLPSAALAGGRHGHPDASPFRHPYGRPYERPYDRPYDRPLRGAPMALVGTVVEVIPGAAAEGKGGATQSAGSAAAQLVLELEQPDWVGRGVSRQLTISVDDEAVLLAADLSPLDLASLAAGDTVMVTPKMTWGTLTVQLLYAGTAEELAAHSFYGRLVSSEDDTLQIQARGDEDALIVVVDDTTVWLDRGSGMGPQPRPADLPEDIPLQVIGVEQEDGSVRAVVVAGPMGM